MNEAQYQDLSLIVFIVFGMSAFVMIGNVVYFQIRFQRSADRLIHGGNVIDGGWLYNSQRMMMYAHYCLFKKRAVKAKVYTQVKQLPQNIKFHLLLHWGMVMLSGLLLVLLSLMDYIYLE